MDLTEAYVAGCFSFVAAIVALLGVAWTLRSTATINNKNVFITTVTHERAKWRDELRAAAAEFTKLAIGEIREPKLERALRLEELRVLIRLRLNPNPRHELDASIIENTAQVVALLQSRNTEEARETLGIVENAIQRLLKQEWEKSKNEAVMGKITADDAQPTAQADGPASGGSAA